MSQQPHVGLSLVNKAPIGMVITALVAVIANVLLELNIITLGYAVTGGIVSAVLLLAYWLGKGGLFFILGVSIPLVLVLLTPLASIAALLNLVSGFFFGFCAALLIYKLVKPADINKPNL
ncbi:MULTISPECIES: hypothetical protein [Pseudoalteromonas]|uniref:Uncharacterized protein n=1 Tax=Pseudoalteromonas undina TaxID=43660 RepID=A0ACC6R7Q5_9GAMM|nr:MULTISPECIES: hypothetical protein [unclassified Pseudoalteromonas]KPZ53943.1 hypothetical protein AN393_02520 [Pseudoalteromonas sp. P1-25]KPZ54210.1 hypothetical protein AN391_03013 [Pseudoalteromonas sp. P1-13-1a]KPZ61874.1 hypothetical protein AN389_01234 [Pseudoalteromonas sp. P1-7a]